MPSLLPSQLLLYLYTEEKTKGSLLAKMVSLGRSPGKKNTVDVCKRESKQYI